jgi:hypothetical protein
VDSNRYLPSFLAVWQVGKQVGIGLFSGSNLSIRHCRQFALARSLGKTAAILPEKPKQELESAVRHIDHGFDARPKLVIPRQEIGFARQVFLDRLSYARVKKLGVPSGAGRSDTPIPTQALTVPLRRKIAISALDTSPRASANTISASSSSGAVNS